MRILRLLRLLSLSALMAVLTSGCMFFTKDAYKPLKPQSLTQRQTYLINLSNWDLSGRISIITEEEGWNGSLIWKQLKEDKYDIKIIAPLGQGTLRLLGSVEDGVELSSSNTSKILEANTPENLLRQQMGWEIPVSGMRFWILGLASPAPYRNLKLDGNGRPESFEQVGWTIRFLRYKQIDKIKINAKVEVPDKILLQNEQFKVKVIVKSWNLEA